MTPTLTTPVTRPQGPTHPTPTHPPRSLWGTQPTNDPDPVTNPQRPKPRLASYVPFVVFGLGAGLFLAAVGVLGMVGTR